MSKVTEELDFMWEKRVLDYYNELKELGARDKKGFYIDRMLAISTTLTLMGLTVKGIEG